TTGITPEQIEEMNALSGEKGLGGLIAPKFAIGAIVLMQFAAQAAPDLRHLEILVLQLAPAAVAPRGRGGASACLGG
ncbi:hypothetical protein ACJBYS_11850, partial [Streptococcus suis]